LFADSYSIVVTCRKHFSQLLNYMGLKIVRQNEMYTAEPLVTEPSAFEDKLVIEKLKSHKSPGIDQILAECTKAKEEQFTKRSLKLTFFWNKEELLEEWKNSIIVAIYKTGDKQIVVIIGHINVASYV